MAARAMWKGVLVIGREKIPVKLYSAVQERRVSFRLLRESTKSPVKQRMVNPETGEEVASTTARKGFETAEGTFVVLTKDELSALVPESSREIHVSRFLSATKIEEPYYDRPYYLGPDGDADAYASLTAALESEGKVGVAHWTMRNKEYVGALRLEAGRLLLVTLRHADEVIPLAALPTPKGRAPEANEIKMAEQLVAALAGDFDPEEFHDEYRERVEKLVQSKARGHKPKMPRATKRKAADDDDLEKKLAASLKSMRAA
jgi:DNA end-binding protein Ku